MKKPRVLVAMSGGVDSSVAALLLKQQGYDVVGATMQVWDYSNCNIEEGSGTCCSSTDVDDARSVADRLQIPFYVLNCEEEFRQAVIDPFIANYLQGKTPLPCVNCNTFLKFDHLVQKMRELDCDYLATGHYAQTGKNVFGEDCIRTSQDLWKDQTYFLFTLQQGILQKLLFPVGRLQKSEVRQLALEAGLVVARKKDSTGICFVGDQGYGKFIEENAPKEKLLGQEGWIRHYPSGKKMARHQGIYHFTLGQSRGLGMDHHEKLFVLRLDVNSKTVWVGAEEFLFLDSMLVKDIHWLGVPPKSNERVVVKIRSTHSGVFASVEPEGLNQWRVQFEEPQRAVTPGQAAVFYRVSSEMEKSKELLGGGWIEDLPAFCETDLETPVMKSTNVKVFNKRKSFGENTRSGTTIL